MYGRSKRAWRLGVLAVAGVASCLLPQAARARVVHTTWTAFMRAGPGEQYVVLDEVEKFSAVDVLACARDWCQVSVARAEGYMRADVLEPSPLTPPPPASGEQPAPCVTETLQGYRGHEAWRICGR